MTDQNLSEEKQPIEKKDLLEILNEKLYPLGFKRKGNFWTAKTEQLTKQVDLQRSNFSPRYYINYRFIIHELDLDGRSHVFGGMGGENESDNTFIQNFLDLKDENFKDKARFLSLLEHSVIRHLKEVNTTVDLRYYIDNHLPTLNMLPLIVRNYFSIRVEN